MARPVLPNAAPTLTASSGMRAEQVSGNPIKGIPNAMTASASIYRPKQKPNPQTDRGQIAKPWQIEAYRQVNICGEARYAATLFAAMAGRAEIGVSQPNALNSRAVWVETGPEVDAFAELAPSVRERSKLIRDYMTHYTIAGECYLIARTRVETDPGYVDPPEMDELDLFDPDFEAPVDPNPPLWEIVAVTELQKKGDSTWEVRHDNGNYLPLAEDDPVIRLWNPDPSQRREAWSPFRSLLPTLKEIEWLTAHIFTQVRSRLLSAGVWFLPDNLTFPPPPPEAVEGGAEAIAAMNEAEQFMVSLAASGMAQLDSNEVAFPSIVMAEPAALAAIDQKKLIQFWSEIDDKAMILRSDAVRRFALGMDMPPEQVLGSSGLAVSGTSGSAGSVNHWGEWAKEEQTIQNHIEPALDGLVGVLTVAVIRRVVENTVLVVGYDTATLRMRQDRSKESVELYDRGALKASVMVRENGFDPANDMMDDKEFKRWLLTKIAGGSATPEQVQESLRLLGVVLETPLGEVSGNPDRQAEPAPGHPGTNEPGNLDDHPYEGPPREQHDHSPAPYRAEHGAVLAASEVLVLRALEKAGNRLLNDGKRGRDRDRSTPPHLAHVVAGGQTAPEFDFTLLPTVLADLPAADQMEVGVRLNRYCTSLYNDGTGYSRDGLIEALS